MRYLTATCMLILLYQNIITSEGAGRILIGIKSTMILFFMERKLSCLFCIIPHLVINKWTYLKKKLRRFAPHISDFLLDFRNPRVLSIQGLIQILPIEPHFSFHILILSSFKCHSKKFHKILVIFS